MAGPWERFQVQDTGPWARYGQPVPASGSSASPPSQESKASGWADTIDAYGRGIANAAMFGYSDEIGAGVDYLGSHTLPWRDPKTYDQALTDLRKENTDLADQHPVANVAGNLTGAVGAGGAITKAGLSFGAKAAASGAGLGRVALGSAADGGVWGALSGFGSGEGGAANRTKQAIRDMFMGTAIGAASVPVAAGIGALFNKASKSGALDALSGVSSAADKYIRKQLSNPEKLVEAQRQLARLGPEATLADVSPEWLGVARGAASEPGIRDAIVEPLNARQSMANTRLQTDLDANLGRPIIPSQVDAELAAGQETIGQRYPEVMRGARATDTQPIADSLDAAAANVRGPERQALVNVRSYLNIPGTHELDPSPQALHAIRETIDGQLGTEANTKVIRQLMDARRQVDEALAQAVPGIKEVDAPYHELARQREALQMGRPILNNEASALRPQEVQDMLTEGANPQGLMVGPSGAPFRAKQSVRAEIDRAVGTKANDVTALRNIVRGEGDWNRQKLGMLFGPENADRALGAIDRESVFGDTAQRVTRGSDTALADNFSNMLQETKRAADVPGDTTVAGLGIKGAKALISGMMEKNAEKEAARYASDIGKFSVATGPERDDLLKALLSRGNKAVVDRQRVEMIRQLLQSAGQGTRPLLPSPF